MAAKLEIDLSDELSQRLQKVASEVALSPAETAKMILAHQLAAEKAIDWGELISKGRQILRRLLS